jgi:hypothetical protein
VQPPTPQQFREFRRFAPFRRMPQRCSVLRQAFPKLFFQAAGLRVEEFGGAFETAAIHNNKYDKKIKSKKEI